MRPVDLAERLGAKRNGVGWKSRCPAHDDSEPSLSIGEGDDGRVLLKCHAGCETDAVCKAIGISSSDLFASEKRTDNGKVSLARLAAHKRLSESFLRGLGWHDLPGGGVGIPYRDAEGNVYATKTRTALVAKEGSRWEKGKPLRPYGLDRLADARELDYLVIVEGETDSVTGWYHGIPTLGLPGADTVDTLKAEHIAGIKTICYYREPDKGGETLAKRLPARLRALGFAGKVIELAIDGVKDLSELHKQDPESFKSTLAALVEKSLPAADADTVKIVDAATRALSVGGATARFPTAIQTLDKNTRGGFRGGKRIILGGAPGAGKTTLLTQLLWYYASVLGHLVMLLACDEEAEDILIRIGQINGIDRESMERGDPDARERLAAVLRAVPNFLIIDGDEDEVTVEAASGELARRRAPGQLSVFGGDSIQTMRVAGDTECDGPRARIDLVMKALKRAGKVDGHLVIVTCELARGAYRSVNPAERIDDLAAFKESGGIEYGASMAMVLRPVKDMDGYVDVRTAKNRMGTKAPFRLCLDSRAARFTEVALPDEDTESTGPSPLELAKDKILRVVEKSVVPPKTFNDLRNRAKLKKSTFLQAMRELKEERRIVQTDAGYVLEVPEVPAGSREVPGTRSEVQVPEVPFPKREPGNGNLNGNPEPANQVGNLPPIEIDPVTRRMSRRPR
jgi:replicative DNA helicase